MKSSPFTLRSHADLLATFRTSDQKCVVLPQVAPYPFPVQHYFAWSEPSGVYTYLVFKRSDWELPLGLVFSRNGSGNALSPAGMCQWCHSSGPSDEIGLLTTTLNSHSSGGTWLCLDLSCQQKIEEQTGMVGKSTEKKIQKLNEKIGEFFQRVRLDEEKA